MQRHALFLALALAVAAPAWADTGTGAGATAGHHRDTVVEKLQLNPDQAQKFRDIMREQQTKLDALRAETHQRLATVLTPDQLKRYDELTRNRPHHMHAGGKPGSTTPTTQTTPAANTPVTQTPPASTSPAAAAAPAKPTLPAAPKQ